MKIKVKPQIHNRFDIFVKDIRTGQEEQVAYAENIILDKMWNRLCQGSTYFTHIHYGDGVLGGVNELKSSNTQLFNQLAAVAATTDAQVYGTPDNPTSYWRRYITLGLGTANDKSLSEVGIAYGSTATNLVTHALIRDMNGNITTLDKNQYKTVTIYATVYVTLVDNNQDVRLIIPANNDLVSYLLGESFPTAGFYLSQYVYDQSVVTPSAIKSTVKSGTWINDVSNKKRKTSVVRFNTTEGNGHWRDVQVCSLARASLQNTNIYNGLELLGVPIGEGDANETVFRVPSYNIDENSLIIKSNNSVVSNYNLKKDFAHSVGTALNWAAHYSIHMFYSECYYSKNKNYSVNTFSQENNHYIRLCRYANNGDLVYNRALDFKQDTNYLNHRYAISNDGLVIATCKNNGEVVTFNNGRDDIHLGTNLASANMPIDLSGNGDVIAYIKHATSTIIVADYIAGQWINRPSLAAIGEYLLVRISGNGNRVFAVKKSSAIVEIYTYNGLNWDYDFVEAEGNIISIKTYSDDGLHFAYVTSGKGFIAKFNISTGEWDIDSPYTGEIGTWDYHHTGIWASQRKRPNYSHSYLLLAQHLSSQWKNTEVLYDYLGGIIAFPCAVAFEGKIGNDWVSRYACLDRFITDVVFDTPPASGAVITADYTVKGIHKTEQRVIDLQAEIQFGEPEEEEEDD